MTRILVAEYREHGEVLARWTSEDGPSDLEAQHAADADQAIIREYGWSYRWEEVEVPGFPIHHYRVPDSPKMLRETLCVAQTAIGNLYGELDATRQVEHINRLQRLLDECDRHRPLGPDGKHGDLHTPTCGCER